MSWWWIIGGGVGGLIALAAGLEAWVKRNRHRPLSRLSKQRRYDDPNRPRTNDADYELDVKTYMYSCNAISGKSWKIAKDPDGYAKTMMPDSVKGQTK